jgi:hypothetical protein
MGNSSAWDQDASQCGGIYPPGISTVAHDFWICLTFLTIRSRMQAEYRRGPG